MLIRSSLLAIAMLSATAAFGTTQGVYGKLWSKRAVDLGDPTTWAKPKATCVCKDGGVHDTELGVFGIGGASGVCGVPFFNGSGDIVGFSYCYTFMYVGK